MTGEYQTVWVGSTATRRGVFHTDDDCPYITDRHNEVEPSYVEHRPDLDECQWCAGTYVPHHIGYGDSDG